MWSYSLFGHVIWLLRQQNVDTRECNSYWSKTPDHVGGPMEFGPLGRSASPLARGELDHVSRLAGGWLLKTMEGRADDLKAGAEEDSRKAADELAQLRAKLGATGRRREPQTAV